MKYEHVYCRIERDLSRPARDAWVEISISSNSPGIPIRSRPARDAWVEMRIPATMFWPIGLSRPARDAWVEISLAPEVQEAFRSRPARDAWVEIVSGFRIKYHIKVASRKGRVG